MDFNIHEEYMERAIYLAKKGRGKVSPNPMVGCIIVKKGEIIGEGYHQIYGGDHAEVEALKNCKKDPSEASIYISLETCCHYGKTDPCYNAIIDSGIRDIYISMVDPNPKVNGKSIKKLEEMNLNVQYGILNDKSEKLKFNNTSYYSLNDGILYFDDGKTSCQADVQKDVSLGYLIGKIIVTCKKKEVIGAIINFKKNGKYGII